MNDEVFIVAAYTPDAEREELLRNLVSQLHSANKEIILISHSITPNDIVKKCQHHIYDQENKLLFDDRYKFIFWNTVLPDVVVRSKDNCKTYTTLLPVYRLVLLGFGYAKMVGYKYAHYIEYDCKIKDFKIFDINRELLEEYGCVAYTNIHGHPIGFYFAFNLDFYSFSDLKYDEEKFLSKLTEFYPKLHLVEELTRFFFMDNKHPCYKKPELILEEGLIGGLYHSRNSKTTLTSWAVPVVQDNKLCLFISELDDKTMTVEYVINTLYNKVVMQPKTFWFYALCDWNDATFLKILINNNIHLEYDLTDPIVRKKLIENNYTERK